MYRSVYFFDRIRKIEHPTIRCLFIQISSMQPSSKIEFAEKWRVPFRRVPRTAWRYVPFPLLVLFPLFGSTLEWLLASRETLPSPLPDLPPPPPPLRVAAAPVHTQTGARDALQDFMLQSISRLEHGGLRGPSAPVCI